jgi:hypothetical protein
MADKKIWNKDTLDKFMKGHYQNYKILASKSPAEAEMYYEGAIAVIEDMFHSLSRAGIVDLEELELSLIKRV